MSTDRVEFLEGSEIRLEADAADNTIKITADLEFIAAHRPTGLSPADGAGGLPLYVRLKITPYHHPLGVPIGGVQWQIAKDPDFNIFVYESRIVTASDTIVIAADPDTSQPYLEAGTTYYWRARYYDLRDVDSEWSYPMSFGTDAAAVTDTIIQPDIMLPVNNGWIGERRLFVQLSQPMVLGNVDPNKSDLQVSMTPDFAPSDLLVDMQDVDNTTLILNDSVNFRETPAPIYMRGRQKDDVRGIVSAWSHVPTVWLRRAFRDAIVGRETYIKGFTSATSWIDRNGGHVTPDPEYWNEHPLWGGIVPVVYTSPTGNTYDCHRIPGFYCWAETDEIGDDEWVHRVWVSPMPVDDFYLHPAFVTSPSGFLLSQYLSSDAMGTVSPDGVPGGHNPADWSARITSNVQGASGQNNARLWDIHSRYALQLLASVEHAAIDMRLTPRVYRGIRDPHYISSGTGIVVNGFLSHAPGSSFVNEPALRVEISNPNGSGIIEFHSDLNAFSATRHVSRIMTGLHQVLGAHLELYHIPASFETDSRCLNRYYNTVYANIGLAARLTADRIMTSSSYIEMVYGVITSSGGNAFGFSRLMVLNHD